jgi:cytochrome c2
VVALRGDDYIVDFIQNPLAYHPGQRLMPRFTFTQIEIENLVALFNWIENDTVAADDWPLRPIQVFGGSSVMNPESTTTTGDDLTLALGRTIFSQRCASCHSLSPNIVITGPSLATIRDVAAGRVPGQSAQNYIRNSILNPSDYIVADFPDVMQKNFGDVVSSREVDALIAFLMSLES